VEQQPQSTFIQTVIALAQSSALVAFLGGVVKLIQVWAAKRKNAPANLQDVLDEIRRIRVEVDSLSTLQVPALQRRIGRVEDLRDEDRREINGTLEEMQSGLDLLGRKFTSLRNLIATAPPPADHT
jgi:hypothetical protein